MMESAMLLIVQLVELQREFESRNANLKSTVNDTVDDIKSGFNQAKDNISSNSQSTQNIEQVNQSFGYPKRRSISERFNQSACNTARRDMAGIHASTADAFESLASRNDDTFAQNALSDRYL
jgi:hypothetical protein